MKRLQNKAPRWGIYFAITPIIEIVYNKSMKIRRAYQYRFYPNQQQRIQLAQTFGCTRFVYNWALKLRTDAYYQHQQKMSYYVTDINF